MLTPEQEKEINAYKDFMILTGAPIGTALRAALDELREARKVINVVRSVEFTAWLRVEIAKAEQEVRAREQAEAVFKSGNDASWEIAARMHPSTSGKAMTKAERMEASAREGRIAIKCRARLQILQSVFKVAIPIDAAMRSEKEGK